MILLIKVNPGSKDLSKMEEKNELQQLRAQSMILPPAMPEKTEEFQINILKLKFKNLQKLLEDTIGNIPDEFLKESFGDF